MLLTFVNNSTNLLNVKEFTTRQEKELIVKTEFPQLVNISLIIENSFCVVENKLSYISGLCQIICDTLLISTILYSPLTQLQNIFPKQKFGPCRIN